MNYKELLTETTAGVSKNGMDWYVDTYCPHHLFDGAPMDKCPEGGEPECCHKCWEREVSDEVVKAAWDAVTKIDDGALNKITDKVNSIPHEQVMSAKDIKAALDRAAEHPEETPAGMIKDSGERTQFSSGACRDMHAGKGDMISLPSAAILRLSKHYENGALKYGRWNYTKGIPVSSFLDSGLRHLFKYLDGWDDEDHLSAAAFNILGAMEMEAHHKELIDLPTREGKNCFDYI